MSLVIDIDAIVDESTSPLLGTAESWARVRLGEVSHVLNGFAFKSSQFRKEVGVPLVRIRDIGKTRTTSHYDGPYESQYMIDPGDLLIGMDGDFRVARWRGPPALLNQRVCKISVDLRFYDSQFLEMALQGYLDAIHDNTSSQTVTHLSSRTITQIPLPLPPLAEQKRIVERVEALLAQVNAGTDRLAQVKLILKRFRRTVLARACSGRLTKDWRDRHQNESLASRLAGRRTAPDPNTRGLPELPDSWVWARLPEVGELGRGRSRHRPRNDPKLYVGVYPFIQTGDVARSGGRIMSHEQTYNEHGLAQSRLWPAGTVCITIAANIAESSLLTYPACFPDSIVGLVTDPSICLPEYAEFLIRTARSDLAHYAPATAQRNINLEILSEVMVPLPPPDEQIEIVRRVRACFAVAEAVEGRVVAVMSRAQHLSRAILAKAFRGRLVPTEAELARVEGRHYESAEELLRRIAATRAGAEPSRKRRGKVRAR